jgi:hypothetical protein
MKGIPMFRTFLCMACLASAPVLAQTAGDDQPSTENWWDRVGAGFFSDDGLTLLRPEPEIRAHWTALSADDQAAVLERCAILMTQAGSAETSGAAVPSTQLGSNTDLGEEAAQDGAAASPMPEDTAQLPADEAAPRTEGTADLAVDTADQTTVTGAVDGAEAHSADEDVQGYTGLAGGVEPEDAQLRPVCAVVTEI